MHRLRRRAFQPFGPVPSLTYVPTPQPHPARVSGSDDLALVQHFLRSRGEDAFRSLYRIHTPALYALALRLADGDAGEAEVLVQESWLSAVRVLSTFHAESTLHSWLTRFVVSVRRERLRTAWRTVERPADEPIVLHGVTGDAPDLERAIAGLPEGTRDVFVLHDVEGYTHEEIAEMLGIVVGTSKSQLNRARRLLRESLP